MQDSEYEAVEMSDKAAQERVRMYERSKLRWFFAIATFDSAAAANRVYEECDGIEFEESSTRFDLRFVPDTEDFTHREVRPLSLHSEKHSSKLNQMFHGHVNPVNTLFL